MRKSISLPLDTSCHIWNTFSGTSRLPEPFFGEQMRRIFSFSVLVKSFICNTRGPSSSSESSSRLEDTGCLVLVESGSGALVVSVLLLGGGDADKVLLASRGLFHHSRSLARLLLSELRGLRGWLHRGFLQPWGLAVKFALEDTWSI